MKVIVKFVRMQLLIKITTETIVNELLDQFVQIIAGWFKIHDDENHQKNIEDTSGESQKREY